MAEPEPKDTRPRETENGQLIVYVAMGDAGIYIDCPALGYSWEMPRSSYKEDSVQHSFETIVKSNSRGILNRASNGEQFPDKSLEYARKCADEASALPLVYVSNIDNHAKLDFNRQS